MARIEALSACADGSGAEPGATGERYFELGLRCVSAEAGETGLIEAHKWFNLAAMRGYDEAAAHRQEVAREMSRQAIAEAQRAARAFLATH